MIEYYKMALSKYADFTGRSRRSEYWFFALGNVLIYFALAFLGGILAGATGSETAGLIPMILLGIFVLAIIIPSLAVAVRRLHDTGRSGWWYLIGLVPFIGSIVLIVFFCTDSEPGANQWGPNPKTGATTSTASHLVD